ncbi:TPA: hypothetical protein DCQ44_00355 [Candidatus Taylorbacteria bacterium]|nr:hypothetical protein [Candidatus Taylorbacteria bacterium]
MVAHNRSQITKKELQDLTRVFHAQLDRFMEAAMSGFKDSSAIDTFRQKNIDRKKSLKDLAEGLGLDFYVELHASEKRFKQKREEILRQRYSTEAS